MSYPINTRSFTIGWWWRLGEWMRFWIRCPECGLIWFQIGPLEIMIGSGEHND